MNRSVINSIKNSVNVITGCGSGLGKSTLQWFVKNESGPVLGIDRNIPEDFIESLSLEPSQQQQLYIRCQNTFDEKETDKNICEFASQHGQIDNLINVAGVALAFPLYSHNKNAIYEDGHAKNLLEFNTYGTFNMIRNVAKHMVDQPDNKFKVHSKCIINTSSTATTSPFLGQTFYAASCSAIDSMTLCLARELSIYNIRCNTINVGFFETPLTDWQPDEVKQFVARYSLAPSRYGTGIEFAHLVKSIIENSMINGACIRLDAGSRILH